MQKNPGSVLGLGAQIGLPKKWEEKNQDERIETLRDLIRDHLRYSSWSLENIQGKLRLLEKHVHSERDGSMTVPFEEMTSHQNRLSNAPSMMDPLA